MSILHDLMQSVFQGPIIDPLSYPITADPRYAFTSFSKGERVALGGHGGHEEKLRRDWLLLQSITDEERRQTMQEAYKTVVGLDARKAVGIVSRPGG